MSLFDSLKELIGGKLGEAASDLNVDELKNKAGEFLNVDGLSDQAANLKDQVSENLNVDNITEQIGDNINVDGLADKAHETLDQGADNLNGAADQAKDATDHFTEKAQGFLSGLADRFK